MKKLMLLPLLALAIAFISCEKEVVKPLVAISGNFTNTPEITAGFWEVPLPDGTVFPMPKKYIVDGTCTFLGNIDQTKSFLEINTADYKGMFALSAKITLVGEDGDQLVLIGDVYSYPDYSNKGYFHFDSGTGKFKNADGWMNSNGQFDQNGVNTLVAVGEIREPE